MRLERRWMNKFQWLVFITVTIVVIMVIVFTLQPLRLQSKLVSPTLEKVFGQKVQKVVATPSPTPAPPQTPKTFKFDSSTDLKMELEKVNPQVLDSDFE